MEKPVFNIACLLFLHLLTPYLISRVPLIIIPFNAVDMLCFLGISVSLGWKKYSRIIPRFSTQLACKCKISIDHLGQGIQEWSK